MNYPQPRTASEALRLANTEAKAKAILSEGYYFEEDKEMSLIYVCKPGKLSAAYMISTEKDAHLWEGCSCPDFQNRGGYCKHFLAWKYLQAQEESDLAQCEEYDRMMKDCEDMVNGCDPYAKF